MAGTVWARVIWYPGLVMNLVHRPDLPGRVRGAPDADLGPYRADRSLTWDYHLNCAKWPIW